MADKKILFQLEIQGTDVSVRTIEELRAAIKATNDELSKTEIGSEEYRKLERQLGVLKNTQKDVTDSARIAQRQLESSAETGATTYRALNAQLVNARALFKELTDEERRGQVGENLRLEIQRLDKELRDIDASIGQFQRNVGNYSGGIRDAFAQISPALGQAIPGFTQLNAASTLVLDGISQIGQSATATGKLLAGAFIGLQVAGAILDGVQAVREFTGEINTLRGQLGQLSNESDAAIDAATARAQAIKETFSVGAEETIQAANAINKAFSDVDLNQALDLIKNGFLSGANAGGQLLDVLREYPRLFDQMGFSAEEFLTIQAKAGQEGVFSDKGVDAVKEFGIRIREQTVATRTSLEEAFGREFTQNLFENLNAGTITVRDALVRVSTKLKETELPAKQLQQVITNTFGGPGEDAGDEFLKSLSDIDKGLSATIDTTDEYTRRLQEQVAAEEALAQSKVEVTKKLNEFTVGTQTLGTQVKTFGIDLFGKFLDAIRPVTDAFGRAREKVSEFLRNIGLLSREGSAVNTILNGIGAVLSVIGNVIGFVVNRFSDLLGAFNQMAQSSAVLRAAFSAIGTPIRFLIELLSNLPATFAGIVEVAKQAGRNIGFFFSGLVVEAQIAAAELAKLNPFNQNDDQISAQIAALRGKRAEIQSAGKSLAEAFKTGFESVPKPKAAIETPAGEIAPTSGAPTTGGAGTSAAFSTTEQQKANDAAEKAAQEAQERYTNQRIELLRSLAKRLADATIESISDRYEKEIETERANFENLKAELSRQEQTLIEQQKAAREKVVTGFGAKSAEVSGFDAKAAADLEAFREQARQVTEQNERNHLARIEQIRTEAANDQNAIQLERLKNQISQRDAALVSSERDLQNQLNQQIQAVLNSTDFTDAAKQEILVAIKFKADQAGLREQLNAIDDEVELLQGRLDEISSGDATSASIAEFEFISGKIDELQAKRIQAEKDYTQSVATESQTRLSTRLQESEQAIQTAGQIVSIIGQFQQAEYQREIENLNEKEQARQRSIQSIEEALKTATGAEKKQLEARLKNEQQALKAVQESKEATEKEERKRQKTFAIIQAVINTAAAVVKTLGTLGVPAGIPAAVLAAALGAAQIAVIAAQPAATGRLVGADIPGQKPGLVVMAQNIPELSNGDNVLATLKRGEVVLNKKQQAALGGAPAFRAIQVPGFAEGGVAGSVISAPDISGTSASERVRFLEKISGQLADGIAATNARIDRMRAYVVSEDVSDDLAETAAIQAKATLGE